MRLARSWDGCDVTYISTNSGYKDAVAAMAEQRGQPSPRFYTVPDVNRWSGKSRLAACMLRISLIVLRTRPDAIITTGAAPGLMALAAGVPLGARRIWVDSIANADTISLSGRNAKRIATLWLTQWPHLANETEGPAYRGSVI